MGNEVSAGEAEDATVTVMSCVQIVALALLSHILHRALTFCPVALLG